MHVTVTTADITGETIGDATVVGEEMERWLRDAEGFEGFLLLAGETKAVGLAFWASREVAERHNHARTQFRERILSIAGARDRGRRRLPGRVRAARAGADRRRHRGRALAGKPALAISRRLGVREAGVGDLLVGRLLLDAGAVPERGLVHGVGAPVRPPTRASRQGLGSSDARGRRRRSRRRAPFRRRR